MEAYKLYSFDKINGYELFGVLPERRRNPERITPESIMKWGRKILGSNGEGKKVYFMRITLSNI